MSKKSSTRNIVDESKEERLVPMDDDHQESSKLSLSMTEPGDAPSGRVSENLATAADTGHKRIRLLPLRVSIFRRPVKSRDRTQTWKTCSSKVLAFLEDSREPMVDFTYFVDGDAETMTNPKAITKEQISASRQQTLPLDIIGMPLQVKLFLTREELVLTFVAGYVGG